MKCKSLDELDVNWGTIVLNQSAIQSITDYNMNNVADYGFKGANVSVCIPQRHILYPTKMTKMDTLHNDRKTSLKWDTVRFSTPRPTCRRTW